MRPSDVREAVGELDSARLSAPLLVVFTCVLVISRICKDFLLFCFAVDFTALFTTAKEPFEPIVIILKFVFRSGLFGAACGAIYTRGDKVRKKPSGVRADWISAQQGVVA
jgi:hypothetical protein